MIDTKGKVLHICSLDKFIPPFMDFLETHFDDFRCRHLFAIASNHRPFSYQQRDNTVSCGNGYLNQLFYLPWLAVAMIRADKIVIHNLFNPYKVILLALMPWLLKKSYWVIWGGDLYGPHFSERNWQWKVQEFLRKPVIRNMGYLVTGTPGDVKFARAMYKARGTHMRCFIYPSNVFRPDFSFDNCKRSGTNILVGNSAAPSNCHMEIFDLLKKYKDDDVNIICPLSYGNLDYAREVIEYGAEIFGKKFLPLKEFLEIDEYLSFLQSIDIAIFNHERQQAFGNILMLLGYGKKVFLRRESTLHDLLEDLGIVFFNSENISINGLTSQLAESNRRIILEKFSEKALCNSLKNWVV